MKKTLSCVFGLFMATAGVASVYGDYLSPVGVTVSGDVLSYNDVSKLIGDAADASYIQSNPDASTLGDLWEVTTVSDRNPDSAAGAAHAILTFDLGGQYDVSTMHLWRYVRDGNDINGYPNNFHTINTFTLLGSADGTTFNKIADCNSVFSYASAYATTESVQTQELGALSGVNLSNAAGIRYVQFDVVATYDGWLGNPIAQWVGIGEVAFGGTAVPEPHTLGLVGSGLLGLLAYAWRKRR